MIKTALVAAGAFAMMSSMAFAQQASQTTQSASPPSGNATVTASTPMPQSSMPQSSMPATPTMVANTPAGDAPATYPKCTHKGQDRCMSMARR